MDRYENMKKAFAIVLLSVTGSIISPQVGAHHSVASEYAIQDPLQEIVGVVTKVRWASPHVVVYMKVTEGEFAGQEWHILGHAPGLMARVYHIPPGTVTVGTKLRALVWVSKFGTPRATPRAVSVDGSPMLSTLRAADERDIRNGTLGDIVPAEAPPE